MKKIIITISILVVSAVGIYFYAYQGHRNIATEEADFSLTLLKLKSEFSANDSLFNAKYADKTIEIYGKVTAIDLSNQSIMLDEKINVNFAAVIPTSITVSSSVRIKGRYVGFDDLLEEFKIDQAIIIK